MSRDQDDRRTVSVIPLVPAWRVDRPFDYVVPPKFEDRVSVGSLVRMPFGHRKVRGVVVATGGGSASDLEEITGVVTPYPVAPPPLPELLEWIALRYVAPRGRVFQRVVPPRVRVTAEPADPLGTANIDGTVLEGYQGGSELLGALSEGVPGAWCLQAAADEDRGRLVGDLIAAAPGTSLACVPEVRYGNRVIDSVLGRFPGAARVDSSVDEKERASALMGLAAGTTVGIGGRATVLAPARDLRLLIVDEEHHASFKEDRSPRYDARRVALQRARLSGAACVLIASTPSVEWGEAIARGEMGSVVPSRERQKAARPLVQIAPPPPNGLSHDLHRAVRDALRDGDRVGLLVPRRGFARALWCASCRRSLRCPRCEAGLIYARDDSSVLCPRCDYTADAPDRCPSCGGDEFRFVGAGSERLEDQLQHMFPRARVRRMDPAVIEELEGDPKLLVGDADIYVTTWIGTKQVIRPEVKLVGVLDADALIRRPDFRAAERAYQALAAMSEWAGPRSGGGRLVIQSAEANHHSIQAVVRGDHRFFYEREAEHRRELGYPPFGELVKVRASGAAAGDVIARVRSSLDGSVRILGPVPVLERGRGRALEILIKCTDPQDVASALRGILPDVPRGTRLRVDVDPR